MEFYDKALQIEPHNLHTLVNKGLALDKLNRHMEAREFYLDATRKDRVEQFEMLAIKALAFEKLEDFDRAVSYYNRVLDVANVSCTILSGDGNWI